MIDITNGQNEALAVATIMGKLAAAIFVIAFGTDLIFDFVENTVFHRSKPDDDESEDD